MEEDSNNSSHLHTTPPTNTRQRSFFHPTLTSSPSNYFSSTTSPSSSVSPSNGKVIKLHLKIGSNSNGHYKSFLIGQNETFLSLKYRTIEKLGYKKEESSFFYFTINYESNKPTYHSRQALYPNNDEIIYSLLEREELFYEGELLLYFNDIRVLHSSISNNNDRNNNNSINSIRIDSTPIIPVIPDTCTEFNQSFLDSFTPPPSVPDTLLNEIESISIKIGRLQIFHSGKDPWRLLFLFLILTLLFSNFFLFIYFLFLHILEMFFYILQEIHFGIDLLMIHFIFLFVFL